MSCKRHRRQETKTRTPHPCPLLPPWRERGEGGGSRPVHGSPGFTMVEIAISLAVIGFALVAIIGILPFGMQTQKENRQETIIVQDNNVFMNAIRNGERGLDDLTNYVEAITNYQTKYLGSPYSGATFDATQDLGYTPTYPPEFPLTNGFRIVGLLSTPKYTPVAKGGFYSNYVVAFVRSLSGPAFEKVPQTNQDVRNFAFSYRMISEVAPYAYYHTNWVNYLDPAIAGNTNEITRRSNYWWVAKNLQTNLYDVRLIFRWPLLANRTSGTGRQVFRTMASGRIWSTNELYPAAPDSYPQYNLYWFDPRNYVKAQ